MFKCLSLNITSINVDTSMWGHTEWLDFNKKKYRTQFEIKEVFHVSQEMIIHRNRNDWHTV